MLKSIWKKTIERLQVTLDCSSPGGSQERRELQSITKRQVKKKAKLYKGNLTQDGRKVVCLLQPCVRSTKDTFTLFNKVFENLKVCSFESSWYARIFRLAGKSLESSLGSYLGCKRRAVRITGAFSTLPAPGQVWVYTLSVLFLPLSKLRQRRHLIRLLGSWHRIVTMTKPVIVSKRKDVKLPHRYI